MGKRKRLDTVVISKEDELVRIVCRDITGYVGETGIHSDALQVVRRLVLEVVIVEEWIAALPSAPASGS